MSHRQRATDIAARLLNQLGPGLDVPAMLAQERPAFAPPMRGGGGGGKRPAIRERNTEQETLDRERLLRFRLLERLGLISPQRS